MVSADPTRSGVCTPFRRQAQVQVITHLSHWPAVNWRFLLLGFDNFAEWLTEFRKAVTRFLVFYKRIQVRNSWWGKCWSRVGSTERLCVPQRATSQHLSASPPRASQFRVWLRPLRHRGQIIGRWWLAQPPDPLPSWGGGSNPLLSVCFPCPLSPSLGLCKSPFTEMQVRSFMNNNRHSFHLFVIITYAIPGVLGALCWERGQRPNVCFLL